MNLNEDSRWMDGWLDRSEEGHIATLTAGLSTAYRSADERAAVATEKNLGS